MMMRHRSQCIALTALFLTLLTAPGLAEDSEVSRATLKGIRAVRIIVEEFQPSLQKYTDKLGPTAAQIHLDIERRLREGDIQVVEANEWLRIPGRPVLYVSINTHETEKYSYVYNIKVELRQIAYLEANKEVRALADTWSINMTGMANIGNLNIVKNDVMVLVERFVHAYRAANKELNKSEHSQPSSASDYSV